MEEEDEEDEELEAIEEEEEPEAKAPASGKKRKAKAGERMSFVYFAVSDSSLRLLRSYRGQKYHFFFFTLKTAARINFGARSNRLIVFIQPRSRGR